MIDGRWFTVLYFHEAITLVAAHDFVCKAAEIVLVDAIWADWMKSDL